MGRLILAILLFISLSLTGCAAKVAESHPKVFGVSVSGLTVQYTDNKGEVITNKKDDEGDGCDPTCYFYPM